MEVEPIVSYGMLKVSSPYPRRARMEVEPFVGYGMLKKGGIAPPCGSMEVIICCLRRGIVTVFNSGDRLRGVSFLLEDRQHFLHYPVLINANGDVWEVHQGVLNVAGEIAETEILPAGLRIQTHQVTVIRCLLCFVLIQGGVVEVAHGVGLFELL